MNIFENYKTSKYFIDISNSLGDEDKKKWSDTVKARFYQKVTADHELESYRITIDDLEQIVEELDHSNLHA